jgi:hypothetical protein
LGLLGHENFLLRLLKIFPVVENLTEEDERNMQHAAVFITPTIFSFSAI